GVRAYLSSSQGSPILYINSEFSSHIQVQVYSALGQSLLEDVYPLRDGENEIGLPQLGSYPTGVYYLTLQKGRERRMLKWIKN
ncbi:MAG: T9SS type A sorting domain-containing protein, partial [Bacteroidota bacterium]